MKNFRLFLPLAAAVLSCCSGANAGELVTQLSDPALMQVLDGDAASPLSLSSVLSRAHESAGVAVPPAAGGGHPHNDQLLRFTESYEKFAAVMAQDVNRLVGELAIDWEKDITKTYDPKLAKTPEGREFRKNGNVTRIFNEKWLNSNTGQFFLSGVVNRMDRRDFTPGSCGEVRFVYRLGYSVEMGGQTYASRTPFTMNMVFNFKDDGEQCRGTAEKWRFSSAGSPVEVSKRLLAGPLDFSRLVFKQMEVNGQVARFPSDLENVTKRGFAGQAIYLMRIFGFREKAFTALKLENTPDVAGIRRSQEKQKILRDFIGTNLKAIDTGVYLLPDSLLADVAISYSTAGSSRVANKPFDLLLKPEEAQALLAKSSDPLHFAGSGRGLLERLNTSTCMGCHQASSTAGFHFLGGDRNDLGVKSKDVHSALDGNRLVLPFSPHFFSEIPRRQQYLAKLAAGEKADNFRPHPSAPPADWTNALPVFSRAGDNMPCPVESEKSFATAALWGCDPAKGSTCSPVVTNSAQSVGLGQCVPAAARIYAGLSCRKNSIQDSAEERAREAKDTLAYNVRAFLDRVGKDEQIYSITEGRLDSAQFNCRPTRIGVPLGRVTKGCTPSQIALKDWKKGVTPDELCAVVGGKGFEEMAKGYFNSKRFAEGVGRGMLNTCSSTKFCREDYICQEMPDFLTNSRFGVSGEVIKDLRERKVGFCTPTYFVYQLRLDGHPNPVTSN